LYQCKQAEQDKSDAQRFHALLQVLGRTCLDAATDEPFSHYHREAAGSVVINTYTAQNQRAQS
jgi:hypothetical protein